MSGEIRRVAIVGAGAMGAMYADHFARTGFDVRLLAQGERARRLRTVGLTVNGSPLDVAVLDTDDPAGWTADLAIFAVKDGHLEEATAHAAAAIGPGTTVLSVLNGLDSEGRIAARLGAGPTVLLCIALAMDAERTGHEVRYTQAGRLVFGPSDPGPAPDPDPDRGSTAATSARLGAVQEVLDRAGLAWETPDDMRHRMWWKFMVNVGVNQASAVLRAPYGAFRHEGPASDLMMALIDEVRLVAAAEGVELTDADVELWRTVLGGQPAEGMTSMHQDVLAGRPTEVDIFAGRVVELGERHGIPVPHNETMLWILRALGELHSA